MLAEIPIGFWAFWLAVGIVLFVAFAWTIVRLAVRWDDRESKQTPPEGEQATNTLDDKTEGSVA